MPSFTPPTRLEASSDHFFGRYSIPVGQSVVRVNGTFITQPYPWLGDLADLTDGVDYFLGGHEYVIDDAIAAELEAAGFTTIPDAGYGVGPYGEQGFGY